jgi:cyanophycinase
MGRSAYGRIPSPPVTIGSGTVALIGGGEFTVSDAVDRHLLAVAGTDRVLVLATAAAYEHPERRVAAAIAWFAGLGAKAEGLGVLARPDATMEGYVEAVRSSRFTYLTGGSPMHLRSVLKDTPLWDALTAAVVDGGVVAGSGAGAMVLTDPMVDPRGGAFTLGLGLVPNLAVVPGADQWSHERLHRTLELARGFPLVTIHTGAAAVVGPSGWSAHGEVAVHREGVELGVEALSSR